MVAETGSWIHLAIETSLEAECGAVAEFLFSFTGIEQEPEVGVSYAAAWLSADLNEKQASPPRLVTTAVRPPGCLKVVLLNDDGPAY